MIVPNKIGSADYAAGVRWVLAVENRLINIRDYSHVPVFPIAVYPIVFRASAKEQPEPAKLTVAYERMNTAETGEWVRVDKRDRPYSRDFSPTPKPPGKYSATRTTPASSRRCGAFPPWAPLQPY